MQGLAAAPARRLAVLRHRGHVVACPICGHGFDRWAPDVDGAPTTCWRCGAYARHRAMWLLWQTRPQLLGGARSLLHFAPEWALEHRLRARRGLRYVSTDLEAPGVDVHQDITAMTDPDGTYDAIICSHVLEHIPDDGLAMRELRRVTAPDGWCLVMTPLDLTRTQTYEDASIVTPEARRAAFSRPDHVRFYAVDIAERLAAAGFAVERLDPAATYGEAACAKASIDPAEIIWLCRPRAGRVDAPPVS